MWGEERRVLNIVQDLLNVSFKLLMLSSLTHFVCFFFLILTSMMDSFSLNQLVILQRLGSRVGNGESKSSLNVERTPFCYHLLL